jgi:cystathionine beta-lyase/cystathionine gamma-synthase
MSQTSYSSSVRSFESVSELREGLDAKAQFEAVDLYPRDGSLLLGEVEAGVAQLTGVERDEALVYASGMAAVTDAIDVALHNSADSDTLPIVACASETYSQTKRYIENFLRNKRARILYFDSGDTEEVGRIIRDRQPDVIVAETVSNYVNVPVLDTVFLLEQVNDQEKAPTIVLDNTLPLSTAEPLGERLRPNDNVIVVESGTKSYSFNVELLGIAYTKNTQLLDYLRRYRRTRGTLPGLQSLDLVSGILPTSREQFDDRNSRLFRNTGDIALQLAFHNGDNSDYVISHPCLPSHANHELYKNRYPDDAAPVFYIQSWKLDQYSVAERLWSHPGVREQAKLGQSFGFDHTRIVADENVGAVRIAGGADTDGTALGEACAEALYDI